MRATRGCVKYSNRRVCAHGSDVDAMVDEEEGAVFSAAACAETEGAAVDDGDATLGEVDAALSAVGVLVFPPRLAPPPLPLELPPPLVPEGPPLPDPPPPI